jgi:hypothetical protein
MPVVFWLLVAGIFGFLLGAGRSLLGFARALSFRFPVGESNPAPLDRLSETRRRQLEAEREEILRKETRQTPAGVVDLRVAPGGPLAAD